MRRCCGCSVSPRRRCSRAGRLRSSAAAHRVLPQRQCGARAGARGGGGERRHAGGRGHRSEQPVRDGEVLPRSAALWCQAVGRRRPVRARGGRARRTLAPDVTLSVADRLPQSDAAADARVPRGAGAWQPTHPARLAFRRSTRGAHRAFRSPGWRCRTRAGTRTPARSRAGPRCVARAPSRALLSRAAAPRQALRRGLHRRRGRARGAPRRAGRCHQRRALPQGGGVRVARGARLHPRGRAARRRRQSAPLHAATVPAHAAGDGGAVRRCAGGARQLGGDRTPLQPGAHSGGGAAAAVPAAGRRVDGAVPARAE